ncbi:hypothetical protein [Kitasatospora sp. NPDC050543]|uniref:hypothetical protein n=1 Tax=Kitasatospora sp. NPDC050543 TaxID=3364054 RepID=UPI0037A5A0F2
MTTTPTSTAHADLTAIARHWDDLRDMLTAHTTTGWIPLMGMHHLDRDDAEQAEAAAERAERTAVAPGERPVPLRVAILDTIQALDGELLHCADQIAASIQRPAATVRPSAGPGDETGRALRLAAATDAADARRWHWNGTRRDGLTAARWLLARIDERPGPFRPLLEGERLRITAVAAGARRRLDTALGLGQREDSIQRRCPCGGPMLLRQGGVLEPEVQCQACGIRWIGAAMVQLIHSEAA